MPRLTHTMTRMPDHRTRRPRILPSFGVRKPGRRRARTLRRGVTMRSRAELSRSGNIVRGLCLLAVLLTVSCRDNYPCISGVTEGTTYEMTFTEESAVGNGVGIESCAGLADVDSLMVGSIVDVYVPHGAQRVDDPE